MNSDITPRLRELSLEPEPLSDGQNEKYIATKTLEPQLGKKLFRFPKLPADVRTSNRYYFFGWYVNTDWLAELARKNRFPTLFGQHQLSDGLQYIRAKSGYRHAYIVTGLVEGEGEGEYDEVCDGLGSDRIFHVLMVWVNVKDYAHRRPTNEQMDRIKEIFGRDPKWFKDGHWMKHFDEYDFYL